MRKISNQFQKIRFKYIKDLEQENRQLKFHILELDTEIDRLNLKIEGLLID